MAEVDIDEFLLRVVFLFLWGKWAMNEAKGLLISFIGHEVIGAHVEYVGVADKLGRDHGCELDLGGDLWFEEYLFAVLLVL